MHSITRLIVGGGIAALAGVGALVFAQTQPPAPQHGIFPRVAPGAYDIVPTLGAFQVHGLPEAQQANMRQMVETSLVSRIGGRRCVTEATQDNAVERFLSPPSGCHMQNNGSASVLNLTLTCTQHVGMVLRATGTPANMMMHIKVDQNGVRMDMDVRITSRRMGDCSAAENAAASAVPPDNEGEAR